MSSIRRSLDVNKKILIFVAVLLVILITLMAKFYVDQKRENRVLRLKLLSMGQTKRTPKTWASLMATPVASKSIPAQTQTQTTTPTNQITSLSDQDTQAIASQLADQMRGTRNAELETLDKSIALADEIISREPDSYGAYKAKLISLLTKEGKYNQEIDEVEINSLLENMAQFNLSSDKMARREAALIGNTNNEIQTVEVQLDGLARDRETLESKLNSMDANSVESAELNAQLAQIEDQETQLLNNIEVLQNTLVANTNQIVNEDIVEIPFMRMLGKSDYEGVIDNAQTFIEQFPNSPTGYFYLVRALDLQGQKDEANRVIQNAKLPSTVQQSLLQRLESQENSDPRNYWQQLNF